MKNRLAPASIGRASLRSFDKSCGPRMSQDTDEDDNEVKNISQGHDARNFGKPQDTL